MNGVSEEVGKTTRGFFEVMRENPLSLALVVVVFALSAMLYYSSAATLEQRSVMAKMIIEWQQQQQIILGGCVSADVTKTMLDNMQRITDTMLVFNKAEIDRMQTALDKERERSFQLLKPSELPTSPQRQNLRPQWLPLQGDEWEMPIVQAFPEHELFKMPP